MTHDTPSTPTPSPTSSQPLDRRTFTVGLLGACALVLGALNLIEPSPAPAVDSTYNNDVMAATAELPQGGDGLYLLDPNTSRLTVINYAANRGAVVVRDSRTLQELIAESR